MAGFRRIQQSLAILVTFLYANTAHAVDEFYETTELPARLIPEYIPCTFQQVRYACFTADQIVALYTLETQARYWHTSWRTGLSILADRQLQLDNYKEQLRLTNGMAARDADFIDALARDYVDVSEDRNNWRLKAENPPAWPLWLGGGLAVFGVGAFVAGLIIR